MGSLAEEMLAHWGKEKLQRASPKLAESLRIPAASKAFLVEVGLPREEIGLISYDLGPEAFPTLAEHARARNANAPPGTAAFRLIGRGNIAPDFYLVDDEHGRIMEVDLEPQAIRFVNSRVEHLGAFLLAFVKSFVREEMSEEENKAYVHRMRADLLKIDPEALAESRHWWPQVLEQMEDGIL